MRSQSLLKRVTGFSRDLFTNLPLAYRLGSGYAVSLLFLFALAIVTVYQTGVLQAAHQRQARQLQIARTAEALARSCSEMMTVIDKGLLLQDALYVSRRVIPVRNEFDEGLKTLSELGAVDSSLEESVARFESQLEPLILYFQTSRWNNLRRSRLSDIDGAYPAIINEFERVAQEATLAAQTAASEAEAARRNLIRQLAVSGLAILVVSAFTSNRSFSHLKGRIHAITDSAGKLAAGSLEQRAPVTTNDEIGQLAQAFNQTADQFQALYADQETRIAERTRQYQALNEQMHTSAELAAAAAMLLDTAILQERVVQMISERFGFYHAGIFLLDDDGEFAVLQAASSPGGRRMLARGHRLTVGQGVVGTAIEHRRSRVVQQVAGSEIHFQNPELPETRAEAALPLRARGQVIGVLDVQSISPEAFTPALVSVLQTLADQIGLAFDNARLYQQAQERLEEMRRLYEEYSREAWRELARSRGVSAYRYRQDRGVYPVRGEGHAGEGDRGDFFPILVRDQEIGRLRVRKPGASPHWSQAERSILQALSEQIGLALDSARLYQETRRRAAQEQISAQVTARIRETLDMDTVLQTAVEEIRRSLNLPEVNILIGTPDRLQPNGNGHSLEEND